MKKHIKWPHEYVLAGNNKERVTYDQLTMGQWVAGFCRTMRDEADKNCKEAMLNYLISLLDDANDFSWSAAKACHAVLLCRMEQGEIKNFTQTEAIDRVRRAHAQRHVTQNSQNQNKNSSRRDKNSKSMPCQFFNQGTCTHNSTQKLEAFFIDMYAPRALQEMAKLSLTRRLIAKINTRPQKTSKLGRWSKHWHIFWSESYLE